MDLADYKVISLDTNIFSYYLANDPRYFKTIHYIFTLVETGKLKLVTSVITMLEIMSAPHIEGDRILHERYSKVFINYPNLLLVDVNADIAVTAASLRRKYQLRTPDAILLATAIVSKADIFITNDLRLKKVKEIKIITLDDIKK